MGSPGLGGVGLGCSQLGYDFDQGNEIRDEGKYLRCGVAACAGAHREQAGCGPEGVSRMGALR